jgi:hypothetical protein
MPAGRRSGGIATRGHPRQGLLNRILAILNPLKWFSGNAGRLDLGASTYISIRTYLYKYTKHICFVPPPCLGKP